MRKPARSRGPSTPTSGSTRHDSPQWRRHSPTSSATSIRIGADAYAENAGALETELERLDAEFEAGLAACESTDLVTSHNAFGYLADRYGLEQVAITGLTPDDEPSPSDLAAVTDFVAENRVRTIYFETLVSPDIAETIAEETGARTAVLDPIEGLDDASEGEDYLEIMRANLANLRTGQPCP